ncbi:MAG: family 78 glycoside hydrolase catalytic domain [Clostridia bacterium]|nr:family 78 glycoside hydrolase catalytic domain [Clostridia bacterium]
MQQAKWIWANTPVQADEYVTFYDEFTYSSGFVKMDISVAGDYAVYINGALVAFEQYPDYEHYKVYDSLDVTPWLKTGNNQIKIVAWYIGEDCSTCVQMSRGVYYKIYSQDGVLAYSDKRTLYSLNQDYVSYQQKKITTQLGYSYAYDTRYMDEPTERFSAVEVDGFENLVLRQNQKTRLGEYVVAKLVDQKQRIYDLGKERCGFLRVKFRAESGEKIRVTFGEHLIDGKVRDIIGNRDFSVELIGNGKTVEFTGVFRRLGCRYLQAYCASDVQIDEIGIWEVEYPFTVKPYEIQDELRKKIYETSVRTLQLCAHEHYEDCPWREQAMYIQDSRNQMLCGYYAFENLEFARASILLILQGQREDGLFEMCFPAKIEFTIPSFSLAFPAMVLEYTQAAQDTEIAKKALSAIEKMLAFFLNRLQENGLFKTVGDKTLWHFYEWAGDLDGSFFSEDDNEKERNGYDVLINAFLSWSCGKTVELCRLLGEYEKAKYYQSIIAKLNQAIHSAFFDEQNQLYKTYLGRFEYSQLANALCVLCGACPSEYLQAVAEKIAYGYDGWVENTLSMNIFRFDALLAVNKEKYSAFILQEIDRIYGKMLQEGATSFWETEKGAADFGDAGSLCHGWSALPIYYYHVLKIVKN